MSKAKASDDLKRWKDKYFSLQEQYDQDQLEAEAFRSILQRLLLRVCLSAEGQSRNFDEQLKLVRDDIKDNQITADKLGVRLESLNSALAILDDAKDTHAKEYGLIVVQMVEQLQALKPPRSERRGLKHLSKLLLNDKLRSERFVPLLRDYSVIQKDVLAFVAEGLPESKGLVSRLFGSSHQASSDEPTRDADASLTEDDLELDAASDLEDENEEMPGFSAISAHVRGTLNHLLKQLSFPPSSQRALSDLKMKISGPLNWYELGPTLDDVANVVISAVGKGQKDINNFLSDVDDRLNKLQSVVLDVLRVDDNIRVEERRLDEAVRDQIGHISLSLENEEDLESLKSSIQKQMDSISEVLDHFSEASQEAETSKEQELEEMKARFQALEEETTYFRQRLKEERNKALTDALTQLPNREAFDDRFEMEYERWKRYQKPATLVIADVDLFKRINDDYGHLSGDKVLQILAKELQARLRKTDFIARYGGEEFVFILPETSIETAEEVMNKTREAITKLPFHFRDERLTVSLSFGLIAFRDEYTQEQLFEKADKALYVAKKSGRNRVEVAS